MTQQACEGLHGVSASQVEMNCGIQFFDGIETSDIQKILVKSASDLISLEAPNYEYVAARLLLYGLRKNVFHEFDYPILLEALVKHNIDRGVYDKDLLTYYDDAEWDKLNKMIDHNRDENFTYAGLQQVVDKYLVQDRSSGDVYETPQFMYILIAATLFAQYPKQTRLQYVKRYYNAISTFKINIPTLLWRVFGLYSRSSLLVYWLMLMILLTPYLILTVLLVIMSRNEQASVSTQVELGESMQKLGAEKYNILVLFFLKKFEATVRCCTQNGVRGGSATTHFLSGIKKSTTSLYSKITKGQKTTE